MSMEIAVFLNSEGRTISLNQSGRVLVYSNKEKEWKVINQVEFESTELMDCKTIRENIKKMAESLGKCKVFVASEVKGIPYTILDGMGFNIWKVDGVPLDFLESVYQNEEEERENKNKPEEMPVPIKNGNDKSYYFDLKTEMQNNSSFTSKQMLIPFLHDTEFEELEIICGHVPPWFDGEFKKLNLESTVEAIRESTFKVIVYSKKSSEV